MVTFLPSVYETVLHQVASLSESFLMKGILRLFLSGVCKTMLFQVAGLNAEILH